MVLLWIGVVALLISLGNVSLAQRTLEFILDTTAARQLEAQAIASQLRELGIRVEVRIWEPAVLRDEVQAGRRVAYMQDWGSAYFDPFDLAEPKLTIGGRGNFSFYENPRVDELLRQASTTNDPEMRRRAYFEVQRIIHEEAPWIFGYTLQNIEAASTEVQNWAPAMDSRINLHRVGLSRGDTLVVALRTNAIITLDPAMHRDRETETVIRNIFDGLVTRTHGSDVVPELAESWRQVSPTTYVFTLRRGVRFHNGDPLTPEDVVYTFERILREGAIGGQTSPRRGLLGPLERVEKVTETQVRFVLSAPFPPFLQALVHFQIVPRRYIQQVGDRVFAERPIGTGPFRFVRGRLDSDILLERFALYYGGSPDIPPVGPARLRRAVFRMMPEPSTRIAALLAGEVHIVQAVPPDLLGRLENNPRVQVKVAEGTRVYMIELNNKRPPFNDVRVRQALNYAINWDEILRSIYRGYGQRLATAFLPSGFGYDPTLRPYPYDPQRARQLLREAGYTVR